jgi:lipoprotein NlpD
VVPATVSPGGWRWPTQGQLIGRFVAGDPKRQGLDIAGTAGQPVVAAADGVVVYSGAGLVGYGELIIIKHSDEWLSAYAHNRKRLVAEGAAVNAGQTIAEMGRTGTSRDMLHFEVRRNGKPVDPLQVLPPL